jgi:hypothetical protein
MPQIRFTIITVFIIYFKAVTFYKPGTYMCTRTPAPALAPRLHSRACTPTPTCTPRLAQLCPHLCSHSHWHPAPHMLALARSCPHSHLHAHTCTCMPAPHLHTYTLPVTPSADTDTDTRHANATTTTLQAPVQCEGLTCRTLSQEDRRQDKYPAQQ